jgi:hypothetical protein
MLSKKPAGDDQFRSPRKDPGEMQRHHVSRKRALVGLQLIIAVGQDTQHVHKKRVAIDIRPCGGSLGEGLERLGTAELVGRRAGDEPYLGVAPAHRRLIAFAGMDDRGPAEPEAVVVRAEFDLGVANLLDEEAIAGLNLRLAAEMPNEIGNRQYVRGLTEMAFGEKDEAYDRRRDPSQPISQDIVFPGRNARRHRRLHIVQIVRSVLHLAKRQHRETILIRSTETSRLWRLDTVDGRDGCGDSLLTTIPGFSLDIL